MLRLLSLSALATGVTLATAGAQTCPNGACQRPAPEPELIPGGAAVTDDDSSSDEGERQGRRRGGDWDPAQVIQRLDTDGDGLVQFSELPDNDRAQRIRNLDTDGDEAISEAELAARPDGRSDRRRGDWDPAALIERSDSDGDGLLQLTEITETERRERLAPADTDGDGAISEAELVAFAAERRERAGSSAVTDRRSYSGDSAGETPFP